MRLKNYAAIRDSKEYRMAREAYLQDGEQRSGSRGVSAPRVASASPPRTLHAAFVKPAAPQPASRTT